MLAEIRALRKVLSQQAVGIFVAPTLPRALRVTEIDIEVSIDPELCMLSHLGTLVPSQGLAQVRWKLHDSFGDSITDCFSAVPGKSRTVFNGPRDLPCVAGAEAS